MIDNTATGVDKHPATWRVRLRQFLRLLAATFVGIAAVVAGYLLGRVLKQYVPGTPAAVFGGALVLATFKEGFAELGKLSEYIAAGGVKSLYGFTTFILITAATLVAASIPRVDPPQSQSQLNPVFFVSGVYKTPAQPDGGFVISVPFFQEAQSCTVSDAYGGGSKLDGASKGLLGNLAKGLVHCAANGKSVKVLVRGFASSSPVSGEGCQNDSEQQNLLIADARADAVVATLQAAVKGETATNAGAQVVISHELWSSPSAMRASMQFNDTSSQTKKIDVDRGDLTRRADVIILDAGDCRRVTQ